MQDTGFGFPVSSFPFKNRGRGRGRNQRNKSIPRFRSQPRSRKLRSNSTLNGELETGNLLFF